MRRVFGFVNLAALLLVFAIAVLVPSLARSQGAKPLPPQTLMSKLKWRCVGPFIGGRVVTVTGVPGNNNLFYAGTVGGGVWKSTDRRGRVGKHHRWQAARAEFEHRRGRGGAVGSQHALRRHRRS